MQKIQKQNFVTNKLNKNIKSKEPNHTKYNSDRPEPKVPLSLPTKGEQRIINNNERKMPATSLALLKGKESNCLNE